MPEEMFGVPAPGGGEFVGPGGQAPPFAPGGIENPYPPEAGMPPNPLAMAEQAQLLKANYETFQPGFLGSGAIGDPMRGAGAPYDTRDAGPLFPPPLAAVGGAGAGSTQYPSPGFLQQLPGHGTTPGQFQPGGGVSNLPQAGTLPTQRPGRQDSGFLARIVPVSGDVSRIIPVSGGSPGQPLPGEPPTVGGGPIIPPMPGLPGFPTPPIVIPPGEGGGPTTGKPKGLKTLPMPAGKQPPSTPPKPPGQWVTLDAGRGQPPAYGFIEDSSSGGDSGLEPSPKPASTPGTKPSLEKGHYVPVQLPYDVQPVSLQDEMIWAWVPTIDTTYGVKEPEPEPKK